MRAMVLASLSFGLVLIFAAAAPVLAVAFVALAFVGYASVSFLSMGNSTLQLETEPQMRGRVMALWSVAFIGSTPIGGPAIGWITAVSGARAGLGVGALSCFVAAGLGFLAIRHFGDAKDARARREVDPSIIDVALLGPATET
jgi:MFS family permease